jgi:hydrogenase nickel incorporation protein HypB
MCMTCGCGHGVTSVDGKSVVAEDRVHRHDDGTVHAHAPSHAGQSGFRPRSAPAHAPGMSQARTLQIEQDILAANNVHAQANRRLFAERGIFALNVVSSPGSGKTTLLVRTIEALRERFPISVVEGDQQTSLDADRIRATGVRAAQVNTGKGCHLDAHMVAHALEHLDPGDGGVVLIENVGNLVCPAAFDLGEAHKVVVLSVTEGDDKPLKYPDMFHAADLMLINKIDLAPYVDFDVDAAIGYARRMRPGLAALCVSAKTGAGFDAWLEWIAHGAGNAKAARDADNHGLRERVAELEARLAQSTAGFDAKT